MATIITSAEALGGITQGDYYFNGTDYFLMTEKGLTRLTHLGSATFTSPTITDGMLTSPILSGSILIDIVPLFVTPDDAQYAGTEVGGTNVIPPGYTKVILNANTNGVNDFFVLPDVTVVQQGYEITIIAGAANCEMRTPASSGQEINSEDCDGTKEYEITAGTITKVIKISDTIGWMAHGYTAIGAVQTAVVPDE